MYGVQRCCHDVAGLCPRDSYIALWPVYSLRMLGFVVLPMVCVEEAKELQPFPRRRACTQRQKKGKKEGVAAIVFT